MARSVTVSAIVTAARERADEEASRRVTDAELVRYVNDAWARLYAKHAQAFIDFYRTEEEIAVVAGTAGYDLPDDWWGTISLDYKASTDDYRPLHRVQEHERNRYRGTMSGDYPRGYRIIGNQVVLMPTPSRSLTLVHAYLPTATVLTDLADEIDGILGHEVLLQLMVARRIMQKNEEYEGDFEKEIAQLEEELTQEALMRSVVEPQIVEGGGFDGRSPEQRWRDGDGF